MTVSVLGTGRLRLAERVKLGAVTVWIAAMTKRRRDDRGKMCRWCRWLGLDKDLLQNVLLLAPLKPKMILLLLGDYNTGAGLKFSQKSNLQNSTETCEEQQKSAHRSLGGPRKLEGGGRTHGEMMRIEENDGWRVGLVRKDTRRIEIVVSQPAAGPAAPKL